MIKLSESAFKAYFKMAQATKEVTAQASEVFEDQDDLKTLELSDNEAFRDDFKIHDSVAIEELKALSTDDDLLIEPAFPDALPLTVEAAIQQLPPSFHHLLKERFRIQFTHVE